MERSIYPPHSKTECIAWASGDWPWPIKGSWKTCSEWKTHFSHMEVTAYIEVHGYDMDHIKEDIKNSIIECAENAIVKAGLTAVTLSFLNTEGSLAVALVVLKETFIQCIQKKPLKGLLNILFHLKHLLLGHKGFKVILIFLP